ncbi:MAG: glycogen synthase GlgA [Oscillospiraceae bacterium]
MNILYAVSEAAPFIKTGGLADVAGSLPKALCKAGADTRVILPLYGNIANEWREKMTFCLYTYIQLAWRRQYCGLFRLEHEGVCYYFIDNEYYFKRDQIYGCADDGERFAFFSKAVIEIMPLLNWQPDVINCNDWQTALIPIYLRLEQADFYSGIKTVFTIHNIEYQGRFGTDTATDVFGLPNELFDSGIIRYDNDINLMKGAIYKSDYVTTVSPSYAMELSDPYYSCGLHKVIEENGFKFSGIVNGLDVERYNPATDKKIAENFDFLDIDGKKACKSALCRELGFDENDNSPIIACVSRLVGHKGFDLVSEALDRLMSRNVRLIILGTGDKNYENRFRDAEYRYKGRVSANIMYSEQRASMVYAGADMMLMPSRSEPCGLTQMISMRYGTVPIVRAVGGLKDTVRPYWSENSNGFTFSNYSADDMLGTIDAALSLYSNTDEWHGLMYRDMTEDLSWSQSAEKYLEIYNKLVK